MRKLFATILAVCALSSYAYAQETPAGNDSLQLKLAQLEKKVATLEKKATTWDKINKYVKISGFMQTGYKWEDTGSNTFFIKRARLTFAGDIYKGKAGTADWKMQVDFASSPKIIDLFINYRPFNELGFNLGQFKMPITLENTEYVPPVKIQFIEASLLVRRLVRWNNDVTGIGCSGREMGFKMYGGFIQKEGYSIINYDLAVMNGNGINTKDNNQSKDYFARAIIRPCKTFSIGLNYQYGLMDGTKATASPYASYLSDEKHVQVTRYGAGLGWDTKSGFLHAEYLAGKTGSIVSEGAYLCGGVVLHKGLNAVARIDYFNENKRLCLDENNVRQYEYTLGMNYMPCKYILLQLNYTLQMFGNGYIKAYSSNGRKFCNGISVMANIIL